MDPDTELVENAGTPNRYDPVLPEIICSILNVLLLPIFTKALTVPEEDTHCEELALPDVAPELKIALLADTESVTLYNLNNNPAGFGVDPVLDVHNT